MNGKKKTPILVSAVTLAIAAPVEAAIDGHSSEQFIHGVPNSLLGVQHSISEFEKSAQKRTHYNLINSDFSAELIYSFEAIANTWKQLRDNRSDRIEFSNNPEKYFLKNGLDLTRLLTREQINLAKLAYSEEMIDYLESGFYEEFVAKLSSSGYLNNVSEGKYQDEIEYLINENVREISALVDKAIADDLDGFSGLVSAAEHYDGKLVEEIKLLAGPTAVVVVVDIVAVANVMVAGGGGGGGCSGDCHSHSIFRDLNTATLLAKAVSGKDYAAVISDEYEKTIRHVEGIVASYVGKYSEARSVSLSSDEKMLMERILTKMALKGVA